MRIAAVILAAGEGRRMGGPKALLSVGGETFLARAARLLSDAGAAPVIAVLGHDAERVRSEARLPADTIVALNPGYRVGMLSSVLRGLDAAEAQGAEAVLLHPVDHPLVAPATLTRVLQALRDGARIVVPSHAGRRGHPGGFSAACWPALRAAPADSGARAVLAAHPDWILHVTGDPGCIAGIDTPDDFSRLIAAARDRESL